MQTGDKVFKDCIMVAKTEMGFSDALVFGCGTILPSYGMSNNGVVEWQELPWRGGAIENAKEDGSVDPVITVLGSKCCPKDGEWEILGTDVKMFLTCGDTFPDIYQNYIWALR